METFGEKQTKISCYEQIAFSLDVIKSLKEDSESPYKEESIREELDQILQILPEEVKVVHFGEDVFVSRAKKQDKVILIWREKEVREYANEIQENL